MRLKTYKMAMSILFKFLTLKWNISRTIWCIEVGDGMFFLHFALSFRLNFLFDLSFPLRNWYNCHTNHDERFRKYIFCTLIVCLIRESEKQRKYPSPRFHTVVLPTECTFLLVSMFIFGSLFYDGHTIINIYSMKGYCIIYFEHRNDVRNIVKLV